MYTLSVYVCVCMYEFVCAFACARTHALIYFQELLFFVLFLSVYLKSISFSRVLSVFNVCENAFTTVTCTFLSMTPDRYSMQYRHILRSRQVLTTSERLSTRSRTTIGWSWLYETGDGREARKIRCSKTQIVEGWTFADVCQFRS